MKLRIRFLYSLLTMSSRNLSAYLQMVLMLGIRVCCIKEALVPLIFHWPKGITKSSEKSSLASTLDIMPTLIDAAGGEILCNYGKSLLPLMQDAELDQPIRKNFAVGGIHARVWRPWTPLLQAYVSREKHLA